MIVPFEQIQQIIKLNPGKDRILAGRAYSSKLRLHIEGEGMNEALKRCEYFASAEVFEVQKRYAVSNVDLFARVLQQEDMIFMARGGSSYFKLPDAKEQVMNAAIANIEYGMNLRKWVKTFALPAYRCDPMGAIFMEREQAAIDGNGNYIMARAYPTYKSIFSIYDYQCTGRRMEWICFQLSVAEALSFGIKDETLKDKVPSNELTMFFRFVDDKKDVIVKKGETISLVETATKLMVPATSITQKNPLANPWSRTPAFIISDIIDYKNTSIFLSPVHDCIELAGTFLEDRSVRNLQKKFHGFSKAVEPLLQCGTCAGLKVVNGVDCKDCTPPGGQPTGYKLKTKVSDVARFPLDILEKNSFDYQKIFGYVSPDIKGWEKQDSSLESLEEQIEMTYWGTVRMKRPSPGDQGNNSEPITATESTSNQAPKEARLNQTADWAESTENMIADFEGEYLFPNEFKKAAISYGRDYILKTAEELMRAYQDLLTKGSPDFAKDEALAKYYQAKYQNNQLQLEKYLKMLKVEPFPHNTTSEVEASQVVPFADKLAKRYFGEWADTVPDIDWIMKKALDLKETLRQYIEKKNIIEPKPAPVAT